MNNSPNYKPPLDQFNIIRFVLFIGLIASNTLVSSQSFKNIKSQSSPLILKSQGSFYVGGDIVEQTQDELGSFAPAGHITINQMYVRYMVPEKIKHAFSVVMIHGMALTGKSWETTPDGRMGWDEYFVRKGCAVFIPDQVGRGRSGFNQAVFNDARIGKIAANDIPPMWRFGDENAWPNFRIGTKPDSAFASEQYPIEALSELSKQGVPDISTTLADPNPTYKALADLSIQLNGAILISHSQSGHFPLMAALSDSQSIKGMILVEPGFVPSFTDEQIKKLAKIPILIIYGDHLDLETGVPGHSWQRVYEHYIAFEKRINDAAGKAVVYYLPGNGIHGNSHMIMQDKNNVEIADMILKWISVNISQE